MTSGIILENSEGPIDTVEILAQEILNMPMLPTTADMVSDACKLAKALMELGSEGRGGL